MRRADQRCMDTHIATSERPTDRDLQQQVLSALDGDAVDRAAIGVTVSYGVVTLQGRVRSRRQAWIAEQAAYSTPGVLGIANELHVEIDPRDNDTVIAELAVKALAGNRAVTPATVKVMVSAGYVTLCGVVADLHERGAAERTVSGLAGIRGVWNALRVAQAPEPRVQILQEQ